MLKGAYYRLSLVQICISLICVLGIGITNNSEARAYGECELSGNFCSTPWTTGLTRTITVPSYPGCSLTVEFKMRDCNGWTEIELDHIESIQGDCSALFNDIFPYGLFNGVDETVTITIWKEAYDELSKLLFEEMYNALAPQHKYLLECGGNGGWGEYHLIDGACKSLCLSYYTGTTGPEDSYIIFGYNRCETACCGYIKRYCFDTSTGTVTLVGELGPIYVGDGTPQSCEQATPPTCSGGTWNYTGACVFECEAGE